MFNFQFSLIVILRSG